MWRNVDLFMPILINNQNRSVMILFCYPFLRLLLYIVALQIHCCVKSQFSNQCDDTDFSEDVCAVPITGPDTVCIIS